MQTLFHAAMLPNGGSFEKSAQPAFMRFCGRGALCGAGFSKMREASRASV
jgi:hypothetical protein